MISQYWYDNTNIITHHLCCQYCMFSYVFMSLHMELITWVHPYIWNHLKKMIRHALCLMPLWSHCFTSLHMELITSLHPYISDHLKKNDNTCPQFDATWSHYSIACGIVPMCPPSARHSLLTTLIVCIFFYFFFVNWQISIFKRTFHNHLLLQVIFLLKETRYPHVSFKSCPKFK